MSHLAPIMHSTRTRVVDGKMIGHKKLSSLWFFGYYFVLRYVFDSDNLELGLDGLESRRSDTGSRLDSEVGDLYREY